MDQVPNATRIKNTYKNISNLEQAKLIKCVKLKNDNRQEYISLTPSGHALAEEIRFEFSSPGNGWNNQLGAFPFELQDPPAPDSPFFEHHMLQTEVMLQIEKLKVKHPNMQLDFRDNRYCATKYEYMGVKKKIKPDAEIKVSGDIMMCEFDRRTEYFAKFLDKFKIIFIT